MSKRFKSTGDFFKVLDVNGDGVIQHEEFQRSMKKIFKGRGPDPDHYGRSSQMLFRGPNANSVSGSEHGTGVLAPHGVWIMQMPIYLELCMFLCIYI